MPLSCLAIHNAPRGSKSGGGSGGMIYPRRSRGNRASMKVMWNGAASGAWQDMQA